jgi:arylsulfatase A-like enzyme
MTASASDRRRAGPAALICLALLTGGWSGDAGTAQPEVPAAPRPNIVLIVADDLDESLLEYMPAVRDRLTTHGVRFENSFVSQPLCGPSRASILTGLYPHNHRVTENNAYQGFRASGLERSSLAPRLQRAGYRTGLIGKYQNNYPAGDDAYVPPGWSDWEALLLDQAAGYYDYSLNVNGRVVRYGKGASDYQTDVLAQRAVAFVERGEATDAQPFFLYIAVAPPHAPAIPAPRHVSAYPNATAPRPPSFNETDLGDKPSWLRSRPLLDAGDIEIIDRRYKRRLRSLLALDELVERLFEALERAGELDDTYVFFTSDNGLLQGQHRFVEDKDLPYEEAIRVPLLARGPGLARSESRAQFVLNIDLAPTFAEIAGAAAGRDVDGRSLLPLLSSPPQADGWREDVLLERASTAGAPAYVGLRTAEHVYVRYETTKGVEEELYDLRRDPYQLEALDVRRHGELVARLSRRLSALSTCRGASCR